MSRKHIHARRQKAPVVPPNKTPILTVKGLRDTLRLPRDEDGSLTNLPPKATVCLEAYSTDRGEWVLVFLRGASVERRDGVDRLYLWGSEEEDLYDDSPAADDADDYSSPDVGDPPSSR